MVDLDEYKLDSFPNSGEDDVFPKTNVFRFGKADGDHPNIIMSNGVEYKLCEVARTPGNVYVEILHKFNYLIKGKNDWISFEINFTYPTSNFSFPSNNGGG